MKDASGYRTTEQREEQKAIGKQGRQDRKTSRLQITTQGDVDLAQIRAKARQERKTMEDASGYRTTEQEKDQEAISKQGRQDRKLAKTSGEEERLTMKDASGYRTTEQKTEGRQSRKNIGKQTEGDISKIKAEGTEGRTSMDKEDELAAKKENRAAGRQKALARSF
jgi:hypothetical protein